MTFPKAAVARLLADVHRRCCVCHRFCGTKMETDHIIPKAEGGTDEIKNAIAVCFECHAEIHAYNDKHPRGRKFSPEELRYHKEQWLKICREAPGVLETPQTSDRQVGPIQALIDELEFNRTVAERNQDARTTGGRGALFRESRFDNALAMGAISMLEDTLKRQILHAYAAMARANSLISAEVQQHVVQPGRGGIDKLASAAIGEAEPLISDALNGLSACLSSGDV